MQQLGFRSVFAKLFASVMLALILFAVAMVLLTQLVHDKDSSIRSKVLATQILGQIDPFLQDLNVSISEQNRLQSRFILAVIKKSFDIFSESLQAKMALYDNQGHLLMQTDNSDLPAELPALPSLLSRAFPSFTDKPPTQQAQVYSSTGYTLLYESRLPPKKPVLSAALNLFTGTLLLLIIMAGVLWWIARSMTWRINQMSQQMNELGDGDFTARVNARGNDEIALLARGFNQAAQKIEHLINANSLLLAHASHELRTPITRIRLQIEMMDMLAAVMPTDTKAKFDKRAQAINRDLAGLNDLVESILLVSRLDAGHVVQQVERLDLYELVNQERQHYSDATLIGEHIVIDGQPTMLTHLIRNLLNNAMLHGKPPVTVFLYGVQTIDEADNVPDYLLQSIMNSSFAEYHHAEYMDFEEQQNLEDNSANLSSNGVSEALHFDDDTLSSKNNTNIEDIVDIDNQLPSPVIYRNGETLSNDNSNDSSDNSEILSTESFLVINESHQNISKMLTNNKTAVSNIVANNNAADSSLFSNYNKLTTDLSDKIKKVIWRSVPDSAEISLSVEDNEKRIKSTKSLDDTFNHKSIENNDSIAIQRKEGLFKKHLKREKPEKICPDHKYVVLAVIDEGNGIPKDKREEIFSPFVRLQQKNKGSGLGLSLVSQIVTAHQGHITTDTINGHTRFLVVLPVKHDPHYNSHEPISHNT